MSAQPSHNPNADPAGAEGVWTPESWRSRPIAHHVLYEDARALEGALRKLGSLPPLVTSWEIERLKTLMGEAQEGKRFLLQGGDCAETLDDCRPDVITNKLKILLQMSLVLVHGSKRPVIRVGRFAGQYAKPRSQQTETRNGGGEETTLPSYFGDLINRAEFSPDARRTDPHLMVRAYQHAAMTLNFVRSLVEGGFADLHHPEYWDLSFFHHADLPPDLRARYERMRSELSGALRFMEALGETSVDELSRVEFFTSHEALNLHYESAQTRRVPRRTMHYNLTTHMPWLGERTRALDGAQVEYLRGVANPVGVKIGPTAQPGEVVALVRALYPGNETGKMALITRMGAARFAAAAEPIVRAVRDEGLRVLWVCDPMHGNTTTTSGGVKTRSFEDILSELEAAFELHAAMGGTLGGVHFELTGEDVTECVGGASGVTEGDLERNYASLCDPRLNYQQSMELAFRIAQRMERPEAE